MAQEDIDRISGWFAGRLPEGWFTAPPQVSVDDKQIKVVGELPAPAVPEGASAAYKSGAEEGAISRFRVETRGYRIFIARGAEHLFKLPVQWGATCGGTTTEFTPGARREEGSGEARKVMIGHRLRWRRHGWGAGRWRSPADFQSF